MGLNLFQVDQNVSALSPADLHLGINKKWRYSEMTENAMQSKDGADSRSMPMDI